uniref:Uncharacterized protein n=1 Tax=Romanomermis culicivorax TaxID=13658 RepID=A0A915HY80_ROMCU
IFSSKFPLQIRQPAVKRYGRSIDRFFSDRGTEINTLKILKRRRFSYRLNNIPSTNQMEKWRLGGVDVLAHGLFGPPFRSAHKNASPVR